MKVKRLSRLSQDIFKDKVEDLNEDKDDDVIFENKDDDIIEDVDEDKVEDLSEEKMEDECDDEVEDISDDKVGDKEDSIEKRTGSPTENDCSITLNGDHSDSAKKTGLNIIESLDSLPDLFSEDFPVEVPDESVPTDSTVSKATINTISSTEDFEVID